MLSGLLALVVLSASAPSVSDAPQRQLDQVPYSLFGAETVGDGRTAFAFGAGFPYIQALAAWNAHEALDLNLDVNSFYGLANAIALGPKIRLLKSDSAALAMELQGEFVLFGQPEVAEVASGGARAITGLRNWAVTPQLIGSTWGRIGSLFGSVAYQGTFDTEPVSPSPLAGNPGAVSYGSNVMFRLGGELKGVGPGGLIHLYGVVGLDIHGRSGDDPLMPELELGFSFPG